MNDQHDQNDHKGQPVGAPPDRLCVDPNSPFHDAALLKTNVEEYCVSEGWVRLAVGKTVDRHGNAMTVKYKGKVEPYLR